MGVMLAFSQVWVPGKDKFYCERAFMTYVERGQLVQAGEVVEHIFQPLYPRQTCCEFPIYATDDTSVK